MSINPQQKLHMVDRRDRILGEVLIVRIEGDRVFAKFASAPNFVTVATMFREFEDAVNDQLFAETDRLQNEIDSLGLRLVSIASDDTLYLDDVQIMNGTDICFRVPNLGLTQIATTTARAG